ncbi:hypothetical protein KGA66_09735 [Actinocrinis puniceicyclus]|uniref:Uncharacterized protein n=1 Tax=Actinocrinis puniceicyclus TaxID=977794 RepID=A0A8J7WJE1_9ACTN|nr:hypothetical protein [Actinocrinis puniceicyclus]MBS2963326.1 hypothetical protein [Actinocrinis puniceicyclus]
MLDAPGFARTRCGPSGDLLGRLAPGSPVSERGTNGQLRVVREYEARLTGHMRALQRTVDGLRITTETVKAEVALARARRLDGDVADG